MDRTCADADRLRDLVERRDEGAAAELLSRQGSRLVDLGYAEAVLAAATALPDLLRNRRIATAVAYARLVRGDWHGARAGFERAAPPSGPLEPGVAWRMGMAHYLRGDLETAGEVFARAALGDEETADEGILLAWSASARWLRGGYDEARALAERSERAAARSGDLRAVAASQTVLTMVAAAAGDRCDTDAHHLVALDAAERAGDVLAEIRLRANRADHLTEQGLATEASRELLVALELSTRSGYVVYRAIAQHNLGDALVCLGRYDEAVESYLAARDAFQAMGSRNTSYALTGLGLVHRIRGELARARAAFEEAAHLAEEVGNRQGLVAALAGLARVRAADDLTEARRLAGRAVALGEGPGHLDALLAQGWIAAMEGDPGAATAVVTAAAGLARRRRDKAALAEALELSACTGSRSAAAELADAIELWTDLGSTLGAARAGLLAARLTADRAGTTAASNRLRALGVRLPWSGIADALALVPAGAGVRIEALGAFRVLRDDTFVPSTEWQSKKARDLLKILVSRRGRPMGRDELIALLWPEDEDDCRTSNRLSVLLSTLRSVLDAPRNDLNGTAALVSDRFTVRLDLTVVDVDVESFAAQATRALYRWRNGGDAVEPLEAAAMAYGGEFCAEDVYESWAVPLREELRALHAAVIRALATASREVGMVDQAVRWLLMVLREDPYDESAHLDLVGTVMEAGRYGDARRFYDTYAERMAEIAVPAAPFPVPV